MFKSSPSHKTILSSPLIHGINYHSNWCYTGRCTDFTMQCHDEAEECHATWHGWTNTWPPDHNNTRKRGRLPHLTLACPLEVLQTTQMASLTTRCMEVQKGHRHVPITKTYRVTPSTCPNTRESMWGTLVIVCWSVCVLEYVEKKDNSPFQVQQLEIYCYYPAIWLVRLG